MRERTTLHRRTLLRDALDVIDADYATDLSLDDVARRIATSRRQLQRCFHEHGGTTFRECLTATRMNRAAELLRTTRFMTIAAVARSVGYRQPAQFAKSFREHHGASPGEYRAAAHAPDGDELLAA